VHHELSFAYLLIEIVDLRHELVSLSHKLVYLAALGICHALVDGFSEEGKHESVVNVVGLDLHNLYDMSV
jgi:hypothetical protein